MKILVVTDHLQRDANGSEVFAGELCRLLERQHELTVIARGEPRPGLLRSPVIAAGDEVTRQADDLAAFLRARLHLDDFDLVYNLGALLFGCQVTHVLGLIGCAAPLVNHFQALLGSYARHEGLDSGAQEVNSALQKTVSRAAVLNVFPSLSELERALREGYGSPISSTLVIPNGVSPEAFRGVEPDSSLLPANRPPLVLATAGRFSDYVKGADLVYRAFAELYRDRQDVFLLSIGNSRRFSEILQGLPAGSWRISDWLPRERLLAALAAADAVVLPSRYEPFGMIAVEAMMLGLPVVATAVGGLRETVSHRETGLLCNLEEGSLGLYLALAELAADREAARAMGRAGHERAAALYSIEQVAGRVDQALRLAALDARVRPVRELLTDFLAAGLAPV